MAAPILITAGGGCCCTGTMPPPVSCVICGCTVVGPYRLRLTRLTGMVRFTGTACDGETFDINPGVKGCVLIGCGPHDADGNSVLEGNNGNPPVTVNGHAGTLSVGGVIQVINPPGCSGRGIALVVGAELRIPDCNFDMSTRIITDLILNELTIGDCDVDSMMGTYVVSPAGGFDSATFVLDRGAC